MRPYFFSYQKGIRKCMKGFPFSSYCIPGAAGCSSCSFNLPLSYSNELEEKIYATGSRPMGFKGVLPISCLFVMVNKLRALDPQENTEVIKALSPCKKV